MRWNYCNLILPRKKLKSFCVFFTLGISLAFFIRSISNPHAHLVLLEYQIENSSMQNTNVSHQMHKHLNTSSSMYSTTVLSLSSSQTNAKAAHKVNTRKDYIKMNKIEKEVFHENVENFVKDYRTKCENETVSQVATEALPLCPCVPEELSHEILEIKFTAPSWDELQAQHNSSMSDGRWRPMHCLSRQKLGVIIPFRDRDSHLRTLLHHTLPILKKQQLDFQIFVVEQVAPDVFNKASMMNVAFHEVRKRAPSINCIVFHDVDMMMELEVNMYHCAPDRPFHLVVSLDKFSYKLFYDNIVGGGLAFPPDVFIKINGYPNSFFGWGGEDDDMYQRIKAQKYSIYRHPPDIGRYKAIKHRRDAMNPSNVNGAKGWQKRPHLYQKDGLNSVKYELLSSEDKGLYHKLTATLESPSRRYRSTEGDCAGGDIMSLNRINQEDCAARCNIKTDCQGFVYFFSHRNCTLKSSMCEQPVFVVRTKSYSKNSTDFEGAVAAESQALEAFKPSPGDCKGYDLDSYDVTLTECAILCALNTKCAGFVYGQRVYTSCWLKNTACDVTKPQDDLVFYRKLQNTENTMDNKDKHISNQEKEQKEQTSHSTTESKKLKEKQSDYVHKDANNSEEIYFDKIQVNCKDQTIGSLLLSKTECADVCRTMKQCSGFIFDSGTTSLPCTLVSGMCKNIRDAKENTTLHRKKFLTSQR